MRNRKLKKLLKFNIPEYDSEALKKTLELAKGVAYGIEKYRMTEVQSILAQVKFIPISTWILKIVIAFFLNIGVLFEMKDGDTNLWVIMSISIPLLCLVSTNEIYNIIQPDLRELLLTVRYSIKKIILIRLIFFGIADFLILLLSILHAFLLGIHFEWGDLLYIIVLYNLMCVGCIYILNHTRETNAIFSCATWGCSLVIINLIIKNILFELVIGKENIILLFIALLSFWKMLSELKDMLGGLRKNEIRGQEFV